MGNNNFQTERVCSIPICEDFTLIFGMLFSFSSSHILLKDNELCVQKQIIWAIYLKLKHNYRVERKQVDNNSYYVKDCIWWI